MSCVYEKDFEKSIRQEKKSKPKNYKRNPLESFVIPGVLNRLFFLCRYWCCNWLLLSGWMIIIFYGLFTVNVYSIDNKYLCALKMLEYILFWWLKLFLTTLSGYHHMPQHSHSECYSNKINLSPEDVLNYAVLQHLCPRLNAKILGKT